MKARIVIEPEDLKLRPVIRRFSCITYLDVILKGREIIRRYSHGLGKYKWRTEFMSRRMRWEIVECGNQDTQVIQPPTVHKCDEHCPGFQERK